MHKNLVKGLGAFRVCMLKLVKLHNEIKHLKNELCISLSSLRACESYSQVIRMLMRSWFRCCDVIKVLGLDFQSELVASSD